jgi:glucose/arabinose dehydrogenase
MKEPAPFQPMSRSAISFVVPLFLLAAGIGSLASIDPKQALTGSSAFVSSTSVTPGTVRKIVPGDLPKPYATESATTKSKIVPRPEGALPKAPSGFDVALYASDLKTPRVLKVAPNGDVFLVETGADQVRVFRGLYSQGKPQQSSVFATGLREPYGMVFFPAGKPKWLYVANTDSVVRFPYATGDLKATAAGKTIIDDLPTSRPRDKDAFAAYDRAVGAGKRPPDHGHWTRDLALSRDGKTLFVGVGSASNNDDPDTHPEEARRADILAYTPEGKFLRIYASGIRNPSGVAVDPKTGELWCSVNERDGLGDNLVPDYISHVQEGGFYGWPYFYLGSNEDPRLVGKHPELRTKAIIPDVLLQAHSASLQMTFYKGKQFPQEYQGDIFASQHGSWNRAVRSGYEVVRVPLKNGKASGVYEDFLTGFLTPEGDVWGRPVGVTSAADGSLLVSDDGSGSIWRVTYRKASGAR